MPRCKRCFVLIDEGETLCDCHREEKNSKNKQYSKSYYQKNSEKIKENRKNYYKEFGE